MKKSEMVEHYRLYHGLVKAARSLVSQGEFGRAVAKCREAWDHADGMMQYGRKYEYQEYSSLEAIEIVLKRAPLLFDFESLDALEELLKSFRRIDKNTNKNLAKGLTASRDLMCRAHELWNCLEAKPGVRQDQLRRILGADQDQWRKIAESWDRMGVVAREKEDASYRLYLRTRMDANATARCPSCGFLHEAQKSSLLEKQHCPKCQTEGQFVLCR